MDKPLLNIYAGYAYTDAYWAATEKDRKAFRQQVVKEAKTLGQAAHMYTVFPARTDIDFMIWTVGEIQEPGKAADALTLYHNTVENWRRFVKPTQVLWGITKPSMYSRGKSEQDIDPIDGARTKFLVIYPFSKTKEWYLMSFDSRQGMMNEHIKLGKQFFDIKQLLVYSFGLQDQEFVVSYETDDLPKFSDLVQQLRSTEGRKYTLLDTPLIVGNHISSEEFVG